MSLRSIFWHLKISKRIFFTPLKLFLCHDWPEDMTSFLQMSFYKGVQWWLFSNPDFRQRARIVDGSTTQRPTSTRRRRRRSSASTPAAENFDVVAVGQLVGIGVGVDEVLEVRQRVNPDSRPCCNRLYYMKIPKLFEDKFKLWMVLVSLVWVLIKSILQLKTVVSILMRNLLQQK